MLKIAHIINPFTAPATSGLFTAQLITFETIHRAKEFSKNTVDVQLFTAQYTEDKDIIPDFFYQTPDLNRSVLDVSKFHNKKKMPLITDILGRLCECANADILIYSNADIALQPYFYSTIAKLIQKGIDSILINRRTIPSFHTSIKLLDDMYSEEGIPHEGIDCFIFRKDMCKRFYFADACIGSGPVGLCFALNIVMNTSCYAWLEEERLTFHIGDDKTWSKDKYHELLKFNFMQYMAIIDHYLCRPGSYTEDKAEMLLSAKCFAKSKLRQLTYYKAFLNRLFCKTGIHPKKLLREGSTNTNLHLK